jgi:hypothetical protein
MTDEIAAYRPSAAPPPAPLALAAIFRPPDSIDRAARDLLGRRVADVLFGRQAERVASGGVRVDIQTTHQLSTPLKGRIEVTGLPSDTPAKLMIMLEWVPRDFNGGASGPGSVVPVVKHFRNVDIRPSGGRWSGDVDLPAEAFDRAGQYRLAVGIHDVEIEGREIMIHVQGMPLSLEVPARVRKGSSVPVRVGVTNTSGGTLTGVTLRVSLPPSWRTRAATAAGPRDLARGEQLTLALEAVAETSGKFMVLAEANTPLGPSTATADVVVSGEPELTLDTLPAVGVRAGEPVEIRVDALNDGAEPLENLDLVIAAVDGVEIIGKPTVRLATVPAKGLRAASWQVKASRDGIFDLPLAASVPGGSKAEEMLRVVVGKDDPDELVPAAAVVEPPLPAGAEAGELTAAGSVTGGTAGAPVVDDFVSGSALAPAGASAAVAGESATGTGGSGGGSPVSAPGGASAGAIGIVLLLAGVVVMSILVAVKLRRGTPARPTVEAQGPPATKVDLQVEVTDPRGATTSRRFTRAPITVGRAPHNDLVLDDPEVSRSHLEIRVEDGRLVVFGVAGAAVTLVDGKPSLRAELCKNSVIGIGRTTLRIL